MPKLVCPGRSAARSTCEAVRCRAGAVANAGVWYGPGSAERHEECRTASGTRLLNPRLELLQRGLQVGVNRSRVAAGLLHRFGPAVAQRLCRFLPFAEL